ncbi:MAG: beta/gamma crystallin-related protein [Thermoanaerobaculia bacterium]|nr:beta/gamma crystallin family protein [Acidobacteriota bacterium]
MRSRILLAAVAFAVFMGPAVHAQERRSGEIGITVFEDPGYRGRNATFRDDVSDLSDYHLNDRVSSFRIARGEYWEVCEHKDFRGRCAVFSSDEPDLRRVSWDEQITSLRRVRRGRGGEEGPRRDYPAPEGRFGLVLYEEENFRGDGREIDREDPNVADFGSRASSLNVSRGSWEICDRPDFRGRCVVVSGEVPSLRAYGMQNRIASARPIRRERESPSDGPPRLILHSRPNFRGDARELTGPDDEISDFNDRAQSATVEGGAWEVCEHARFRGRCVTLRTSVPDLSAYGLRDAITSARPVSGDPRR